MIVDAVDLASVLHTLWIIPMPRSGCKKTIFNEPEERFFTLRNCKIKYTKNNNSASITQNNKVNKFLEMKFSNIATKKA
jgi:hypothetical protein